MRSPTLSVLWIFLLCSHSIYGDALYHWDSYGTHIIEELVIEPDRTHTLQLRLSDVPVADIHQRVPKYQVFRYDQLCDFSQWSELGFNVRSQLDRFQKETLTYHKNFVSDASFYNEYRFLRNLTHAQCVLGCQQHGATLPSTSVHIKEILQFQPKVFTYFWVALNQSVHFAPGQSRYYYYLDFDGQEIFPSNKMSGLTTLYHFSRGAYVTMKPQQLKSRTSYYDFTSGQYYRKEPYLLHGRMKDGNDFQILIPLDSNSYYPSFGRSTCVCQRSISENTRNAALATDIATTARSSLYDTPSTFEASRVKKDNSSLQQSSVQAILSSDVKPYQAMHPYEVLKQDNIFPLSLKQPVPAKNISFRLSFPQKRAASVFLAAMAKTILSQAAAITSPYILGESKKIFQSLIKKASLKLVAPKDSNLGSSNKTFQEAIDQHFSDSPADATLLHDKLVLSVKQIPAQVYGIASPDVDLAKVMERTAHKLEVFRDQIITSLPQVLLEKVLRSIPHPVRPGSQIIVNVQKSLSFYVFSYFIECEVDTFAFTNVSAFSMPYVREDKNYFSVHIPNHILGMDFLNTGWLATMASLQAEKCGQQALASEPTSLLPYCQKETFVPEVMVVAFSLNNGRIILFLGPSVLTLSCFQKASQIISLSYEFNLIYVNNACDFKIQHYHVTRLVKASQEKLVGIDFQLLLTLSVPQISSALSRNYYWLLCVTIALSAVCSLLCLISLLLLYCRYKYKPQLIISDDGAFECSLVTSQPNDILDPSSEISFIAGSTDQQNNFENNIALKTKIPAVCSNLIPPAGKSVKPASH